MSKPASNEARFKAITFLVLNNKTNKTFKMALNPFDIMDYKDIYPHPSDENKVIWEEGGRSYTILNVTFEQFEKFINFGGFP